MDQDRVDAAGALASIADLLEDIVETQIPAEPPADSTSSEAAARPSAPRARRATLAPWRANASAVARPTPAEAPVTTTTRLIRISYPNHPQSYLWPK